MAHFVKVRDGKVIKGIVAEPSFFETFVDDSPGEWIQTSYNTHGGVHTQGGTPLHKNYAGEGYDWDGVGFSPPPPFPSWIKNMDTYLYDPPVPYPTDGNSYKWDEATTSWVLATI